MDKAEALSIAEKELAQLRQATYLELVDRLLDKQEHFERVGSSGARYAVELQAFWDKKPNGNLRVTAAVDDGSVRAWSRPLTADFIRAPDGSFVGE